MPVFLLSATCTLLYLTCVLFLKSAKCDLFQSPSLPGGGRWGPVGSTHNWSGRKTCLVCRYVWAACTSRGGSKDGQHNSPATATPLPNRFLPKVCMVPICLLLYSLYPPHPTPGLWISPELLLLAKPATQPASH